ncbi:MAG TPA: ferrous iron transport protein A [Pyrinomonadaceae bacterium]|nr:ferrous iron transport protein A [Pyrinomonadaceae bacterium]
MTLDKIPRGRIARVTAVEGSAKVTFRLMEMGIVPGAPVRLVKSAPLGDPIQICVRDYHLALRRADAQEIIVTLQSE